MIKSRFDHRTWQEIVGDLVIERTDPGDAINLKIKYNGSLRPTIILEFASYNPEKKEYPNSEEITTFLPDTPYFEVIDDTTGEPMSGDFTRGYPTWKQFVNDGQGLGPEIKKIVSAGGRQFTYQEE